MANIYARQFSGTSTSVRNVTSNYQGNLTSYILKTSSVDIGKFNTKCLIGLGLEAESRVSGSSAGLCYFVYCLCWILFSIQNKLHFVSDTEFPTLSGK